MVYLKSTLCKLVVTIFTEKVLHIRFLENFTEQIENRDAEFTVKCVRKTLDENYILFFSANPKTLCKIWG